MAYISFEPKDYFDIKLYSGNGSTQTITGLDFQPDWTWIKNRNAGEHHVLTDAVRGANKQLNTNRINAEGTLTTQLTAFTSDGFSVGAGSEVNNGSQTYVSWNWKAGTTSGIATNGSTQITPSAYSISQTSGFSIIGYTGIGGQPKAIPHGLGVQPKMFIIKRRNANGSWGVLPQQTSIGHLYLDANTAIGTVNPLSGGVFADSVNFFVSNSGDVNASGGTYVAYCFADVKGFSKMSSYLGNGEASNNTFIYCGFKPKFILHKAMIAENWILWDSTRNTAVNSNGNPTHVIFEPNGAGGENNTTARSIDLLSNGFKIRGNNANFGGSGTEYVFMAFAEEPLVSTNGVPATAR
jgi:hypothetical protein